MKKQCFLDNHWLWEITIWIFFFCKKHVVFVSWTHKRHKNKHKFMISWRQFQKQKKWVKNWEFHFSNLCWMFLRCCWNQISKHSLKPQNWSPKNHRKFGFIVLKEQWQVTCQSIRNTNPEFLCLHFTTLNNKIKVKKIQERTKMWLVEDLHPNCEVQSINHSRKKKRLSMKVCEDVTWAMSPFKWCWAWHLSQNDGCGRVLASTSLKETQKLLIWNCEAASTHSRWSCWLISGEFEITASTGVSKDLNGQS